jgi:microcin C transport system substrate-binding protein
MRNRIILIIIVTLPVLFMGMNAIGSEKLPDHIKWINNDTEAIFASPDAKKGGTLRSSISSFPLTTRYVGPDSNSGLISFLWENQINLVYRHPNTEKRLPGLATHWAYGDDKKTMYFKLNNKARWSDGKPVTADDFIFGLEFMRSKYIIAPWYNDFYNNDFDRVIKYDDHTIAIVMKSPKPELVHFVESLGPQPKHYYKKLTKDFVRKYNWKIVPNTGPYQITKIKKGKSITIKRKKNWWAKDLKYYQGRFNVDKVVFTVIRDYTTIFEYFKKNKIDSFGLTLPNYWHQKAKDLEIYNKGYIKKVWAYTDSPESQRGFFLNQDKEIFKDKNVRYAFAHALNMDKMINGLLRGDYRRLHTGTSGHGKYTNTKIRARAFNINKVESLMQDSGWKRGVDGIWEKGNWKYAVSVIYSYDVHTDRLVLLKEEAKKAGIEMKLKRIDGAAAFKMFLEKKHEVAWMAWGVPERPQYWGQFHSVNAHKPQTNNITNTDDPDLDSLIEGYKDSLSVDDRMELSRKIQEKIHEIGSYIPTYKVGYFRAAHWRWWKFPEVVGTRFSGALFEPFQLGRFWFDPEAHEETLAAMKSGRTFAPETLIDTYFKVD